MTDQMRYEVTIPIVVYVTTTGDDVEVTRAAISSDWGGFFTEAEEAGGVWDCSAEEWEYVENVYAAARNRVAWDDVLALAYDPALGTTDDAS